MSVASPGRLDPAILACPTAQPAPVEYEVAVERYLASAALSPASRRVYRISLTGWSWPLVDREPPVGPERRGARPPVVPLAMLDDASAADRIACALDARSQLADARTVSRELSALRSAVTWWQDMGWISHDATTGLRTPPARARAAVPLTDLQVAVIFRASASLREQALWHLLRDTGAAVPAALALDAGAIDWTGRPTPRALAALDTAGWSKRTGELLRWLLSGRRAGPIFLTTRRAVSSTPTSDVCPLTHRSRMSYRRAAEIFTATTRQLDPEGHGWTLHQLHMPSKSPLAA